MAWHTKKATFRSQGPPTNSRHQHPLTISTVLLAKVLTLLSSMVAFETRGVKQCSRLCLRGRSVAIYGVIDA